MGEMEEVSRPKLERSWVPGPGGPGGVRTEELEGIDSSDFSILRVCCRTWGYLNVTFKQLIFLQSIPYPLMI